MSKRFCFEVKLPFRQSGHQIAPIPSLLTLARYNIFRTCRMCEGEESHYCQGCLRESSEAGGGRWWWRRRRGSWASWWPCRISSCNANSQLCQVPLKDFASRIQIHPGARNPNCCRESIDCSLLGVHGLAGESDWMHTEAGCAELCMRSPCGRVREGVGGGGGRGGGSLTGSWRGRQQHTWRGWHHSTACMRFWGPSGPAF